MISSVDLPRQYFSSSFRYNNWNNAALKGGLQLDSLTTIFYGNVGCWLHQHTDQIWASFNQGFPKGIDNRKITSLLLSSNKRLFAGTQFGLYEHNGQHWTPVELNIDHPHITDLIEYNNQLLILTRNELGHLNLLNESVSFKFLPAPNDYNGKSSLFKTVWLLHSGEVLGLSGKLLVDFVAVLFIFLSITGIIWFISPSVIKKAKKKGKPANRNKKAFRFSVKWHNKIGYYTLIVLVFTTFTGMFLRPPLLITIANSQVNNLPYTILDSPNAWYDQLRSIRYNEKFDVFFVSTSKGMYALTADLKEMIKIPSQPPVSVMGITVFEQQSNDQYLIGSFSGLFRWNPFTGQCFDYMNGQPYIPSAGMSRPVGSHMATGYYTNNNQETYFDYNTGAQQLNAGATFPSMPEMIESHSPVSLWNVALEIHTGRIFQDAIGAFYILIVPLAGLTTIILLLSGLWIYLKKFRG